MTNQFPYIDIHCHKFRADDQLIQILNEDNSLAPYKSLGIHPWDVGKIDVEPEIESIASRSKMNDIVAIGEVGLDRAIDTPLLEQEEVLLKQLLIAERLKKPAIIHCVKAYSEVIHLQKKHKISVPLIFHAFSGNVETTKTLLNHNCFMSFGVRELSRKKAKEVLELIPLSKLFFETDNNENSPIEEVYSQAVSITGLDKSYLKQRVYDNFVSCFGDIYEISIGNAPT